MRLLDNDACQPLQLQRMIIIIHPRFSGSPFSTEAGLKNPGTRISVRYHRSENSQANAHINAAMKTHSKNPELLFQAEFIKTKTGNISEVKKLMQKALTRNTFSDSELKEIRKMFLALREN